MKPEDMTTEQIEERIRRLKLRKGLILAKTKEPRDMTDEELELALIALFAKEHPDRGVWDMPIRDIQRMVNEEMTAEVLADPQISAWQREQLLSDPESFWAPSED